MRSLKHVLILTDPPRTWEEGEGERLPSGSFRVIVSLGYACTGAGWKPTIVVVHCDGTVVSTRLGDEGLREGLLVTGQPITLRSVVEKTKPHVVIISFDTGHWKSFLKNTQPSLFRSVENEPRKAFFLIAAKGIQEAVTGWASQVEAVEVHVYTRVGVARVSREAREHILARLRARDTSSS